MTKAKAFEYAAMAILLGGYFTADGAAALVKQAQLDTRGFEVPGTAEVLNRRISTKKKRPNLQVVWSPLGQGPITQKFRVSHDFLSSLPDGKPIPPPRVTIRYAPTNPAGTAVVVDGTSHRTEMLPIGLGILAIGAGLVIFGVKKSA